MKNYCQVIVRVTSKHYDETVTVYLSKSTPLGFQQINSLVQPVAIQPGNRGVDFTFNYTFTEEDARIGKVSFQAYARAESNYGIDALPADNTATSPPIKVTGAQAQSRQDNEDQKKTIFLPVVER